MRAPQKLTRLPTTSKRFVSELAQGGWVIVVLFMFLGGARPIVAHFYGGGWGFVANVIALAIWLLIRPWRLGLLSPDSRREVRVVGTFAFALWVLLSAVEYFFRR